MKVVILAGGFGTRISEESHLKPKPMIEIGEKPILWHIMKEYSFYGYHDFIICAGYRQHMIKKSDTGIDRRFAGAVDIESKFDGGFAGHAFNRCLTVCVFHKSLPELV